MNILRNRKVIGIVCVGIAALAAFGLNRLNRSGEMMVVQVTADLSPGQVIEDKHVTLVSVSQKINNTYATKEEVVGKYAGIKLYRDEILSRSKVLDTPYGDSGALNTLNENRNAVSITIKSMAKGLSGKLQRGDIVSVVDTGEKLNNAEIVRELTYVQVLSVSTSTGADPENLAQNSSESMAASVTLLATPAQAIRLASIEENGNAHLILVSRGNQEKADELLKKQEVMLG